MSNRTYHKFLLSVVGIVFVWSVINPHDYFTWFLEVVPAVGGFIILALTYRKFPLTNFLYTFIAIHAVILMIGGHYTYAEVPLFNWLRDIGIFSRNNYDKIGHFAQGFIPVLVARELLLRTSPLKPGKWLNVILVCIALAISAVYEIVEWLVSVASGSAGDSFLGTQGYIWDTQSDMLLCGIGAILAIVLLSKIHDRALKNQSIS